MLFFAVKCTRFIAVKITVLNDKLKTVYFLPPPPFLHPSMLQNSTSPFPHEEPWQAQSFTRCPHLLYLQLCLAIFHSWCKLAMFHI